MTAIDPRTPEQLIADGVHRWPDGTLYLPPQLRDRHRRQYLRLLLILEPETPDDADRRCVEFTRAGGEVLCACGEKYLDHPNDVQEPYLHVLCDRSRVKL